MRITKEEAEEIYQRDFKKHEDIVKRLIKVPLTQGQFDALVDWAFNAGETKLRRYENIKRLNAGKYKTFGEILPQYDKAKNVKTGKYERLPGLTKRRKKEAEAFRGFKDYNN